MSAEVRAAVADTAATFKRCLALVRLYHPDHDTVRELAAQAGQKLRAALALAAASPEPSSSITLSVEARSLSFAGKPVMSDDGTETAASTLYVDGIAALVFDAAVTDDGVVKLVRLWGQAADRRSPLPADQTFATLMWESALPGIALVAQQEEAEPDLEQRATQARRHALMAQLLAAAPLPVSTTSAPLPPVDLDNALLSLSTGTLQALPSTQPADRAVLLGLLARTVARTIFEPPSSSSSSSSSASSSSSSAVSAAATSAGLTAVGAALMATVQRARTLAVDRPEVALDLESVCLCLATDEVKASLAAAAEGVDGAELMKVLRYVPRKAVGVLLALCAAPRAKEALAKRLGELSILEAEWPDFVRQAGPDGADVVFALARARGANEAVVVVNAARAVSRGLFVELLRQLRGPEVEAARPLLHDALTDPHSAAVAEDLLVRLKDPVVVPRLLARLHDDSAAVDARRIAALALTRFDGDAGKAGLRAAFGSVKNDDVRSAIASALATARDASARPMLEMVAKKLIVDRGLKKACEDAVKRLNAAGGAT